MRHALSLIALAALTANAHAQTIYRCQGADGKVSMQDTPCSNTQQQSTQGKPTRRDEAYAAHATCVSNKRKDCDEILRKMLVLIDGLDFADETLREIRDQNDVNRQHAIVTARLNFRIAKEDYARADAAANNNIGNSRFSAYLSERSAAHDRLLKARSEYYRLTKIWLD
jgi:hypothetical protein